MEECPICGSYVEEAEKLVCFESEAGFKLELMLRVTFCPECDWYELED